MNSWTWHLARSLFRFAGKSAPAEPEPPPDLAPPERSAPAHVAPPDADAALIRACEALRARQAQGGRHLEAIPEGDWRRFADAITADDGALRAALDGVLAIAAESPAGLRAKAAAIEPLLDGADDGELASRIARALITDAKRVLPASRSAHGPVEEPRHRL
jgi:hypothetical protein